MKKRKLIAILITTFMLLTLIPTVANAAGSNKVSMPSSATFYSKVGKKWVKTGTVNYEYNELGDMIRMEDISYNKKGKVQYKDVRKYEYTYDSDGVTKTVLQKIDDEDFLSKALIQNGRIIKEGYSDQAFSKSKYIYDKKGRLTSIKGDGTITFKYSGRAKKVYYKGKLLQTIKYNNKGFVSFKKDSLSTSTIKYKYNKNKQVSIAYSTTKVGKKTYKSKVVYKHTKENLWSPDYYKKSLNMDSSVLRILNVMGAY